MKLDAARWQSSESRRCGSRRRTATGNYEFENNGDKMITVRPIRDSDDNGLDSARAQEIALKVMHLLPLDNQSSRR
jgi:hypothetical protein